MTLTEVFQRARDNSDIASQSVALGDICSMFRFTRDQQALRVLRSVVIDCEADKENRWLAYLFALEVADTPVEEMPRNTIYNGFQVPQDFDNRLLSRWE